MKGLLLNEAWHSYKSKKVGQFDFITFDVETANSKSESICQIGFVFVQNGKIVKEWVSYVNPQTNDFSNAWKHGITQTTVENSPTFPKVLLQISPFLKDQTLIHHSSNNFDKNALENASQKFGRDLPSSKYINSLFYARDITGKNNGLGLKDLCIQYSIDTTDHHNALADARMLALVVLCLESQYGVRIVEWVKPERKRQEHPSWKKVEATGVVGGPLSGSVFVLTNIFSVDKSELAEKLAAKGADVRPAVTVKTTHLVVGKRDKKYGDTISTNHQKALDINSKGMAVVILSEKELINLLEL
jgi:DNA polymerase III epsilon subunit-like protein